jgi:hypothetical protein
MKTKVVHCRRQPFDVYIGRPSKWGNPFKLGNDADRETVLERYKAWLMEQDELLADLPELRGKILGCWCKPDSCHGDILAELADSQVSAQRPEKLQRQLVSKRRTA